MENYSVSCIQDLVPIEDSLRLGLACVADTAAAFRHGQGDSQVGAASSTRLTAGQAGPLEDSPVIRALTALAAAWNADIVEIGRLSARYVLLPAEN